MRVFAPALLRLSDPDEPQHFQCAAFGRLPAKALMQTQGFADLVAYREHRVEAGHRLLKDHADLISADIAHGALVKL